jgi:hypothetical protein
MRRLQHPLELDQKREDECQWMHKEQVYQLEGDEVRTGSAKEKRESCVRIGFYKWISEDLFAGRLAGAVKSVCRRACRCSWRSMTGTQAGLPVPSQQGLPW